MATARRSLLFRALGLALIVYLLGPIVTALACAGMRAALPSATTVRARNLTALRLARLYEDERPPGGVDIFNWDTDKPCGYDVIALLAKVPPVRWRTASCDRRSPHAATSIWWKQRTK